ncbi:uncharacterized protein MONBRDRAFT_27460 [Monosiga brevicollis MX1]|uniref:Small ribosomal subunit protein uS7 domain-containing protein n=1 Tax=Monosiga brevicollis TaxID=81824 RepID=A9V5C1_MONBE|nr:uncharacterized protein MONBRDRAFT_27460 [Monosiga brevicollis MX1]EDQ87347.1 predicted protein [Monosiga brevicollis MX1]|eukprot:XP_001747960.1 hypothetical protein [Monosiga brevicollis MX1]
MYDGKKTAALRVLQETFIIIKKAKFDEARQAALKQGLVVMTPSGAIPVPKPVNPMQVFQDAIENVKPTVALTPVKKSGSIHQVPTPLTAKRRQSLAIKWIIGAARSRKKLLMPEALAAEIMEAANNTGAAVRKRIETHKMAEANRALAHLRWQ